MVCFIPSPNNFSKLLPNKSPSCVIFHGLIFCNSTLQFCVSLQSALSRAIIIHTSCLNPPTPLLAVIPDADICNVQLFSFKLKRISITCAVSLLWFLDCKLWQLCSLNHWKLIRGISKRFVDIPFYVRNKNILIIRSEKNNHTITKVGTTGVDEVW